VADLTATDSDAAADPAPWAASVAELRGRYVVLERLGEGGMGIVHRAYDPALRREVALKVLRTSGPIARDRMLREAQALARVTHPHVVTVYDVGTAGDDVFIAMELVRGQTLAAWLRAAKHTPEQILEVCVAAGSGLAAAHHAGLVHRDFKPSNVMVGDDGRVRVLDFGLARPTGTLAAEPTSPSPDSPDLLATPITRHGAVVGTPRYMAPEQRSGDAADARSDQYALCLVIEEALAGTRDPSEATTEDGHAPAKTTRPTLPLPRRARAAIARGLEADPAARFATIDDLLDDITPRRRGVQIALVTAIAIVLGGAAIAFAARPTAATPCSAVSQPFDAMWSVPVRETLHAAFVGAAGSLGDSTWPRVTAVIDDWGRSWVDLRHRACEATHVRGEQSAELGDRKMACLEDRRRELAAVLGSFAVADRDVVIGSLRTVRAMEPLARCEDMAALLGAPQPGFGQAPAIAAEQREVDQIAAITHAKKTADTVDRAQKAVDRATKLGFAPLEAEALYQLGQAQINAQRWQPARTSLEAAALAADRARDDRLRAKAWIEDIYVIAWGLQKGDDALHVRELATAALSRVRDPGTLAIDIPRYMASAYQALGKNDEALRSDDEALALIGPTTDLHTKSLVYSSRALSLTALNRYDESLAESRKALDLDIAEYGPDHPSVAGDMSNIANALMMHVGYPEADKLLHQALAIGERSLGPDHPQVATYCNNLVNLYRRQEMWGEALPYARRAVAIREKTLPPNHPLTARAVMNLATIIAADGGPQEAEHLFERGLAMQAKSLPPVHGDIAYARQLHGENLRALGRFADARDEYGRSLELYAKLQPGSASTAMTDGLYARAIVDAGDPKKGLEEADRALPIAVKSDNEIAEAQCRWARADALAGLGRTADAKAEVATILTALRKQKEPDDLNLANEIERWASRKLR